MQKVINDSFKRIGVTLDPRIIALWYGGGDNLVLLAFT
jgi:hypothetical protein